MVESANPNTKKMTVDEFSRLI